MERCLINILRDFNIQHDKIPNPEIIITCIYYQYIRQWIANVPPSRKQLKLNLMMPLMFDQNKGPNLKQMVWMYFCICGLASHHMHAFEDMHETAFWWTYFAFCQCDLVLLSRTNLLHQIKDHNLLHQF